MQQVRNCSWPRRKKNNHALSAELPSRSSRAHHQLPPPATCLDDKHNRRHGIQKPSSHTTNGIMGEGVKGAAAPPPGSVPDFDNPTDVYYTAAVANHCLCIALMTLFFGVRVYVKVVIKRGEHYLEDCTSRRYQCRAYHEVQVNLCQGFCGFAWVSPYNRSRSAASRCSGMGG